MSSKISANDVKKDTILVIDNNLWRVISQPSHVKPGKGPAYIQLEMKNIRTGTKKNERYSSSEVFDKAFIETSKVNYLYSEGDSLVVMDPETFDQMNVDQKELSENEQKLLEDNMELEIQMYDGRVIAVKFPATIIREVISADPNIRNSTVSNVFKNATIKGDINIKVPSFVEAGNKIKINTEDLSFMERAK